MTEVLRCPFAVLQSNTIKLQGLAIHPHMCTIANKGNSHLTITGQSARTAAITRPYLCRAVPPPRADDDGEGVKVYVNGRRVDHVEGRPLHHHDRLVLGRNFAFRLVLPKELKVECPNPGAASKEYVCIAWQERQLDFAMDRVRERAGADGYDMDKAGHERLGGVRFDLIKVIHSSGVG